MDKDTIPYFYIIRHINSGKMYVGSRWIDGCNPEEFMKEDGYTTSSSIIKRKLVGLSKIGKRKFINILTKTIKMFIPGTEPENFVRVK